MPFDPAKFAAAPTKPTAKKQAKKSLLGQLKSQVSGTVAGLPGLAKIVAEEAINSPISPAGQIANVVRLGTGDPGPTARAVEAFASAEGDPVARLKVALAQELPFSEATISSGQRTAGDIVHPSRLKKAYDEGTIVEKVIEDVGNLSLIAGAAGRVATGAKAAQAAGTAGRTEALLARIPQAPLTALEHPYINAGKATARVGTKGLEALATRGAPGAGPLLAAGRGAREGLALRGANQALVRDARALLRSEEAVEGIGRREAQAAPLIAARGADSSLEAAAILDRTKRVAAFDRAEQKWVQQGGKVEDFRSAVMEPALNEDFVVREGLVDPEAADVAMQAHRGRLAPEDAADVARVQEDLEQADLVRRERELEGFGRTDDSTLSVEQLGDQPMRGVIEPRLARPRRLLERAQEEHSKAVAKLGEAKEREAVVHAGVVEGLRGKAALEEAKATTLKATQATKETQRRIIQAETKARLLEQRASRIERGKSTISRESGPVTKARLDVRNAATATNARARRVETMQRRLVKHEQMLTDSLEAAPARFRGALIAGRNGVSELRRMAEENPHAAGFYEQIAAEIPTTLKMLHEQGLAADIGHVKGGVASEGFGPEVKGRQDAVNRRKTAGQRVKHTQQTELTVQGLLKQYDSTVREQVRNITAEKLVKTFGKNIDALVPDAGKRGKALEQVMGEAGFRHANAMFDHPPAGLPDLWLPTPIVNEFRQMFSPVSKAEKVARVIVDKPTRAWKVTVLPLSARWLTGNVVSNMLLAMTVGEVPPHRLIPLMRQARQELGFAAGSEALAGKGRLGRALEQAKALTNAPSPVEGSALASREGALLHDRRLTREFTDAIGDRPQTDNRARLAGRKVIDTSYALNSVVDDMTRAAVMLSELEKGKTPQAALGKALKAMGDYAALSPFERNVVRRLLPFYAWHKHITKVMFQLPIEHPHRVAWTINLSNLADDPDSDLPDWMANNLPLGAKTFLPLNGIIPFDLGRAPIVTPEGLFGSLNPLIKTPAELMNFRVDKGRALTAPKGSERKGFTYVGNEAAAYRLAGLTPQTRLLRDVKGEPVARYETGQPILRSGRTISAQKPGGDIGRVASFFSGLPQPTTFDAEQSGAAKAKADKMAKKAKATYEKKRLIAGRLPSTKR